MAKLTAEDVLEAVSEWNLLELNDFIGKFEEKFGVTAAAPMAMAMPAGGAVEAVEEKDEFTVVLTGAGSNKIGVIKEVRAITSLGLKEAKDLVEGAPQNIKEGANKEEAEKLKAQLEAAGATVELK